jgi:hypothetical protein
MGCRFPVPMIRRVSGAIAPGEDAVKSWERWDLHEYYDANPDALVRRIRHAGPLRLEGSTPSSSA